jgi:hypothetical protein
MAAAALADWRRPRPLGSRGCYTGFGSSVVDHSATSQCHRHLSGGTIDLDVAEELHAGRGRQVLLVEPRRLDELHFGPEGVVEFVRSKGAGVQRPGDELPERLEILELRLVGVVVMRGGIVHIRRQPHGVDHA